MLQLNDDVLVSIFSIVCRVVQDILNLQRICKRFQNLSQSRSIWVNIYTFGGLDRAFGPPSWHSTASLHEHVLRSHRITRNLESDSGTPQFTQRSHEFQCNMDNHRNMHSHGRFLFCTSVTDESILSVLCRDMEKESIVIWEHHYQPEERPVVLRGSFEARACEIRHTDEPGLSVMSVLAQVGEQISLFHLDLIHEPMDSIRLVETKAKSLEINYFDLYDWTPDWTIHGGREKNLILFNNHTWRKYVADDPQRFFLSACSFVGSQPGHIVAFYEPDALQTNTKPVFAVFSFPDSDSDPNSRTLDCIHFAESSLRTHLLGQWGLSWHHPREMEAQGHAISSLLGVGPVTRRKRNDGIFMTSLLLSFIPTPSSTTQCQVTIKTAEHPQDEFCGGGCISQYHDWVLAPLETWDSTASTDLESELFISFTRVIYSKDDVVTFGTPVKVRFPPIITDVHSFSVSFDEHIGRYFLVVTQPTVFQVFSFDFS